MAMPTRERFNFRRDHGFRNPPVQPPCPFPGASGAWQHRGRPPPSPSSSSTPYKNDPQAAFNFRRAPGPWRSDAPLRRFNHQQQPSALADHHPDNERGDPRSSVGGFVIGGAAKLGGAEGAAAAAAAALLGGEAVIETPTTQAETPLDAGGAVFASEGCDGWREASAASRQDQQGPTQPAAVATKRGTSPVMATTAGGSGAGVGCAEEMEVAVTSTPALDDTMRQDRDGRGADRGVAGESVLEAVSMDGEGAEAGGDEEEEGADPDQGWTLSTDWEEYLRKSPGVSKYLQRMQATVSTWKDGRGGKKGGGNNKNKGKSGKKKASNSSSSRSGGTTEQTKQQDSKGSETPFPSSSSKQPRRQLQQQQQQQQQAAAAASHGGKKSGKKQSKNKGASAQGGSAGEGGGDSAAAIAKQALDLELAKIHAQALLYAEQQQHRRVEDAVADVVITGPE